MWFLLWISAFEIVFWMNDLHRRTVKYQKNTKLRFLLTTKYIPSTNILVNFIFLSIWSPYKYLAHPSQGYVGQGTCVKIDLFFDFSLWEPTQISPTNQMQWRKNNRVGTSNILMCRIDPASHLCMKEPQSWTSQMIWCPSASYAFCVFYGSSSSSVVMFYTAVSPKQSF